MNARVRVGEIFLTCYVLSLAVTAWSVLTVRCPRKFLNMPLRSMSERSFDIADFQDGATAVPRSSMCYFWSRSLVITR
jgi:hypothetical protein